MTLKRYLTFMAVATALAWAAWLLVLLKVSPDEVGGWGISLFFISLLMALWGSFTLLGMVIRFLFLKREIVYYQVVNSYRQGLIVAFVITSILLLRSLGILAWWNLILLILGLGILESYFLSFQKTKYNEQ